MNVFLLYLTRIKQTRFVKSQESHEIVFFWDSLCFLNTNRSQTLRQTYKLVIIKKKVKDYSLHHIDNIENLDKICGSNFSDRTKHRLQENTDKDLWQRWFHTYISFSQMTELVFPQIMHHCHHTKVNYIPKYNHSHLPTLKYVSWGHPFIVIASSPVGH